MLARCYACRCECEKTWWAIQARANDYEEDEGEEQSGRNAQAPGSMPQNPAAPQQGTTAVSSRLSALKARLEAERVRAASRAPSRWESSACHASPPLHDDHTV